jgi:hypothetical protein
VRRFAMLALSLSLLLGLSAARLVAQDNPKDDAKAKADDKKADDKKGEDKKADEKKADEKKADEKKAEPELPKEVREKVEAARKAVAEAIAAAEAAGLVQTSIEPPPILDILIDGRASDERILKEKSGKGVSPEVFAAWFTGYGKRELGINYEEDVRIVPPSQGLKDYYDRRAAILKPYLDEARKARGLSAPKPTEAPKAEAKKDETKKDEVKKDDTKKDDTKKDESKAAEKKDDTKKDDAKPEDKPAEKKDDAKKDEPKKDGESR